MLNRRGRQGPAKHKSHGYFPLLSAAQPTDQGEESVFVVVVVVVCGLFSIFPNSQTLSQKGCEKAKTVYVHHGALICQEYYIPCRRSVKGSLLVSKYQVSPRDPVRPVVGDDRGQGNPVGEARMIQEAAGEGGEGLGRASSSSSSSRGGEGLLLVLQDKS